VSRHQVRALLVDANGERIGDAVALSPDGANAGQGQLAMRDDGRGVVAFFVQAPRAFELRATQLRCE
jgi:hypothetical protein